MVLAIIGGGKEIHGERPNIGLLPAKFSKHRLVVAVYRVRRKDRAGHHLREHLKTLCQRIALDLHAEAEVICRCRQPDSGSKPLNSVGYLLCRVLLRTLES